MNWSNYYGNLLKMLEMLFLPGLVKTFIYFFIFRKIDAPVRLLTCFLAAFSPMLIAFVIPFSLPLILSLILGIAVQTFVLNYYADIDFFPTGAAVVGIVEVIIYIVQRFVN